MLVDRLEVLTREQILDYGDVLDALEEAEEDAAEDAEAKNADARRASARK